MSATKDYFIRSEAELILDQTRAAKAERTKDIGSPIKLNGVALDIHIQGDIAWIAENDAVVRKLSLETGKTLRLFKGHTAPVTAIALYEKGDKTLLISASWDKTIKVWDTKTQDLLSSTEAHADFVKTLLVVASLDLLVSSGSDKLIRFWDLSSLEEGKPLVSAGSLSGHTRPVEALAARKIDDTSAVLYTADTMGITKVWELHKEDGPAPRWRSTLKEELNHHRTKINEIIYGNGQLWSASSDDTVQVHYDPPLPTDEKNGVRPMPPITHPTAARALLPLSLSSLAEPYLLTGSGDVIRAYDISSPEEPELLGQNDAHWHDVIALRLWMRKTPIEGHPGKHNVEPWIISASLDSTLRRWRLLDLLKPPSKPTEDAPQQIRPATAPEAEQQGGTGLTEDEERELAELMGDDE